MTGGSEKKNRKSNGSKSSNGEEKKKSSKSLKSKSRGSRSKGWNHALRQIFKQANEDVKHRHTHSGESKDRIVKDFIPSTKFIKAANEVICFFEKKVDSFSEKYRVHSETSTFNDRLAYLALQKAFKSRSLYQRALGNAHDLANRFKAL